MFPDSVLLLTGEDDASMGFVLRHIVRVEAIKIPDLATAQHTTCGGRTYQMVLVRAFNHRRLKGSLHVNARGAKRCDEHLPH